MKTNQEVSGDGGGGYIITCSLEMGRLVNTAEALICLSLPGNTARAPSKRRARVASEVLFIEASITPRYSKIRPVSSSRTPTEAEQRRERRLRGHETTPKV